MRCTPRESTAVTTAGKPSGTAATASATPRMSTSKSAAKPRTSLDEDDRCDHHDGDDDDDSPSSLPTRSSSFCSGVVSVRRFFQHPGDAPHLGLHPCRHDHRAPASVVAAVPLKIMLWRSPSPTSSVIASVSFDTGRLSPVSAASAVCSAVD